MPSAGEQRTPTAVVQLRRTAELLDSAVRIPFTPWRIGLDGLIGLVPGAGDVVGAVLAGGIVLQAMRLGAPSGLLLRMLANVALDAVVGEVPILGDLFDIGFKVNLRNVALLERHLADPRGAQAAGRRFLLVVVLAVALIAAATALLAVLVLRLLWGLVAG